MKKRVEYKDCVRVHVSHFCNNPGVAKESKMANANPVRSLHRSSYNTLIYINFFFLFYLLFIYIHIELKHRMEFRF